MRKKFKIIIFFLVSLLTTFSSFSSDIKLENPGMQDEKFACNDLFNNLKNSDDLMVSNFYSFFEWEDYGFDTEYIYNTAGEIDPKFTKDGNFLIGQIYNDITAEKIEPNDEILLINEKEIRSIEDFYDIIFDKDFDTIELKLFNKSKGEYQVILQKSSNGYRHLKYEIKSFNISDIDIKKGTYDLSINHAFSYYYSDIFDGSDFEDINHPILELALKNLIYYNNGKKRHTYHICDIDEQVFNDKIILDPSAGTRVANLIKSDSDLEEVRSKITPYHELLGNSDNYVKVSKEKFNVLKIKNNFNLKSFPFDKQIIKFQTNDTGYGLDSRIFSKSMFSYKALNKFLMEDDIPGWKKNSFNITHNPYTPVTQLSGTYNDSHLVEIELERKAGYYIFKVILPIILILMVCWSVVWVDPKELEARLTITIVCLLSLIAYNFVIDSELPKLEYLTVLDWIVLISYVYATIPNFLSIISFRLQKTNLNLSTKLEQIAKRYGLSSYVLSIFLIVLINANLNVENSSSLISWMSGKI